MSDVTIEQTSWLTTNDLVTRASGDRLWMPRPTFAWVPRSGDLEYTVNGSERLKDIAQRFYNDDKLWWVIARANRITRISSQVYQGRQLTIPDPGYIRARLDNDEPIIRDIP